MSTNRRWWFGFGRSTKPALRPRLGLEALESRDVPAISLVSGAVSSSTTTGNDASQAFPPGAISDDGQFVVFTSLATNLVSGQTDTNSATDVFLRDTKNGTTTLISGAGGSSTTAADGESIVPYISGDGKWVAFFSQATNLINGVTIPSSGSYQLYLYDRVNGGLKLVSHDADSTTTGVSNSDIPQVGQLALSDDGSKIAYINDTYDLVAGYSSSDSFWTSAGFLPVDAYLYDRATNTNTLVSHTTGSTTTGADDFTTLVNISGDGSTVVFSSYSNNLVTNQSDGGSAVDIFRYNVSTGGITLVTHTASTTATATNVDKDLYVASISYDGSKIAYVSTASNLVSGQTDATGFFPSLDTFLYDSSTGTNYLVSHIYGNSTKSDASFLSGLSGSGPVISGDGKWIAFTSDSKNILSTSFSSGSIDNVFLYEVATGTNSLVSHTFSSTTTPTGGAFPSISDDGAYVVFFGSDDTGNATAIDKYKKSDGSLTMVGLTGSSSGSGDALLGVISADGTTVAFNSLATTLVSGQNDTNGKQDVFVDKASGSTTTPNPPTDLTLTQFVVPALDNTTFAQFVVTSDDPNRVFQYTIDAVNGSANNGQFVVDNTTGTISTGVLGTVQNSYTLLVTATDVNAPSATAQFTISNLTVAHAPTDLSLTQLQVPNTATTTFSQFVVTGDSGRTYTYSLVTGDGTNDADNGKFTVVNTDWLQTISSSTAFPTTTQSTFKVFARVKDSVFSGLFYQEAFTLTLVTAPTGVTSSVVDVPSVPSQSFAQLTTTGPAGQTYSYSLDNSIGDNAQFTVDSNTGALSTAATFNAGTSTTLSVTVHVVDNAFPSLKVDQVLTFNVVQPVTDLALSSVRVPNAAGATVGTITSTGTAGRDYTYELVAGAGDTDNGLFTISGDQLLTGSGFPTSTKTSFDVRIRVADPVFPSLFSYEEAFTLTPLVNAPTDIALTNAATTPTANQTVGAFSATGPAGQTYTFSLVGGTGSTDNAKFSIDASGNLKTSATFPTAAPATYSIRVRATDGEFASLSFEEVFTINVTATPVTPSTPVLAVPVAVTGAEGVVTSLGISAAAGDTNSSVTVTISGVPTGVTLSGGTPQGGGVWTFGPAQLSQLPILTLGAPDNVSFNLQVLATATLAGATSSVSASVPVTINNVPPVITVNAPSVFNPTSAFSMQVSTSDQGADTVQSITIDWGDGVVETFSASGGTFTHQYPVANNSYQIQVSATDEDGTFALPGGVQVSAALATTQQATVAELYIDLLGRSVDTSGLNTYSAMLASGTPVETVITALVSSPEYAQKVINDLYLKYLGRPADPEGLTTHLAIYASGGEKAVAVSLLASDEFFAKSGGTNEGFLSALYLAVLDRPIDDTGMQDFLSQIAFGVSRATIVQQVLDSAEGVSAQVNDAYETFLGREADAGGIQAWAPLVTTDSTMFLVEFLSEPEYASRLVS